MRLANALVLLVWLVPHAANADLPDMAPEARAVRQFILETDSPEVFEPQRREIQLEDLLIADVDNDGSNDVIVHFTPHFRQSASIVFYRINEKFDVSRIVEGLAPGPIRTISGQYADSHVLGVGVDFSVQGMQSDPVARQELIASALSKFGGLVAYRDFYHADSRSGSGSYIDMTHVSDLPHSNNCEAFEFSEVRQVAAGPLENDSRTHIAAWVEGDIWLYRIDAVRDNGLLEKKRWILDAPDGFDGFTPGMGLAYSDRAGKSVLFSLGEHVETD